jgi:CheY-like chemotaxis protein
MSDTPKKVLLAEDYEPNILVATSALEHFGYDYVVARNGLEAIELIKAGGVDIVLMDVQMPGMDGLDATKIVRAWEKETGTVPVIVIGMTAHALKEDRDLCFRAGMDDYISKPFELMSLQELITKHRTPKGA